MRVYALEPSLNRTTNIFSPCSDAAFGNLAYRGQNMRVITLADRDGNDGIRIDSHFFVLARRGFGPVLVIVANESHDFEHVAGVVFVPIVRGTVSPTISGGTVVAWILRLQGGYFRFNRRPRCAPQDQPSCRRSGARRRRRGFSPAPIGSALAGASEARQRVSRDANGRRAPRISGLLEPPMTTERPSSRCGTRLWSRAKKSTVFRSSSRGAPPALSQPPFGIRWPGGCSAGRCSFCSCRGVRRATSTAQDGPPRATGCPAC